MTTVGTDIIAALQDAIVQEVGQDRYDLWFGASARMVLEGPQDVTVEVANPFFQEWLRTNFRAMIEQCCSDVLGCPTRVRFRVNESVGEETASQSKATSSANVPSDSKDEADGSDQAARSERPDRSSRRGNRRSAKNTSHGNVAGRHHGDSTELRRSFATLDSFVVGHANRVAQASAEMVAGRPGCLTPLFLYGGTGVGKTHLLEGIWSSVMARKPRGGALFLAAEQFTTLFVEALHRSGLPNFRRKYRSVELLVLDDVQFFTGKKATLGELLHTIDTLLRHGKQVVLAADRSPAELKGLGPELVSRLSGGMVCRLESPDHPTRREIVRRYAERHDLDLADAVQEVVASRLSDNVRELHGAVNRLHATSLALGSPLTVAQAEEALADLVLHSSRAVQLPDIEKAVCEVFGLRPESLRSQRKIKSVSHPRMLAMWLARKHTRNALSEIGDFFGRRSHTTVISAQRRVNTWMSDGDHVDVADQHWHIEEAIRRVEACMKAS